MVRPTVTVMDASEENPTGWFYAINRMGPGCAFVKVGATKDYLNSLPWAEHNMLAALRSQADYIECLRLLRIERPRAWLSPIVDADAIDREALDKALGEPVWRRSYYKIGEDEICAAMRAVTGQNPRVVFLADITRQWQERWNERGRAWAAARKARS